MAILTASFTSEEKNTVWDDVVSRLSALHATSRNRDDVLKNGGPTGSELTLLEEKIQSINAKQVFEGTASGADMRNEPTRSQVSRHSDQMLTSPLFSTLLYSQQLLISIQKFAKFHVRMRLQSETFP